MRTTLFRVLIAAVILTPILSADAPARPRPEREAPSRTDTGMAMEEGLLVGPAGVLHMAQQDTAYFGGTVWNEDSTRWEALPGGTWTFDSGVGSHYNYDAPGVNQFKFGSDLNPAYTEADKLHAYMEGWIGVDLTFSDLPYFRRIGVSDFPPGEACVGADVGLGGSYSFWAGVLPSEAAEAGYLSSGYGNGWTLCIERGFAYTAPQTVTFEYDYLVTTEPDYDFATVYVDSSGNGDDVELASYTGLTSGHGTHTLLSGTHLPDQSKIIKLRFCALSDGAWSDEDGLFTTNCGAFGVDNVIVTGGGISHASDFELDDGGWKVNTVPGLGGDWSDLMPRGLLPGDSLSYPCAVQDTVLVFYDRRKGLEYTHGEYQDNVAVSPWIDLEAAGLTGAPGKFIEYDHYADMPRLNYIFARFGAQWYPELSPTTGKMGQSKLTSTGSVYYFLEEPFCTNENTGPRRADLSQVVSLGAQQLRIYVGIVNYCRYYPADCTGESNTSPHFDNIRLGVHGTPEAPILLVRDTGCPRDAFPSNPAGVSPSDPGRFDSDVLYAYLDGVGDPQVNTLGDTLVVGTFGGGPVETYIVFAVDPGPGIDGGAFSSWLGAFGGSEFTWRGLDWYSARMDTAEVRGLVDTGSWMTAFHEEDPQFAGSDTDSDPGDLTPLGKGGRLRNDMFPDDLFTPGTRVCLFYRTKYEGGSTWFLSPDTTGGKYLEMEVLPSSMTAGGDHNTILYVDGGWNPNLPATAERALANLLPAGSENFEHTEWDRLDIRTGSEAGMARDAISEYGVTTAQLAGYQTIIYDTRNRHVAVFGNAERVLFDSWLGSASERKNLYLGGYDLPEALGADLLFIAFALNRLGVGFDCQPVRDADCPAGSLADPSLCLGLAAPADPHFGPSAPMLAFGSGGPYPTKLSVLQAGGAGDPRGNLSYVSEIKGVVDYASVSNLNTGSLGHEYRTVVDCLPPNCFVDLDCEGTGAVESRLGDVLLWFEALTPLTAPVVEYADPGTGPAQPNVVMEVQGQGVGYTEATVSLLSKDRLTSIPASLTALGPDRARAEFNLGGAALGIWDLVATNAAGADTLFDGVVVHPEDLQMYRSSAAATGDHAPATTGPAASSARLAFVSGRDGGQDLYVKDIWSADVSVERVTTGVSVFHPSFSPDGARLVYEAGSELFVVGSDPAAPYGPASLLAGGSDQRPAWSPAGNRVAFDRAVGAERAIFVVDTSGTGLTQLTTPGASVTDQDATWSPDGVRILFRRDTPSGNGIYSMRADAGEAGGLIELLPPDANQNRDPAWSPDGRWVAFTSDRDGGDFDVYAVSSRGAAVFGLFRVTTDPGQDLEPVWTSDGALAFTSDRAGYENLYVAAGFDFNGDADGDLVPDLVDACPGEACAPGELDRDLDGCPDPYSNFRFVKSWGEDQTVVRYETDDEGDPRIGDGSDFAELQAAFDVWTGVPGMTISGGDDGTRLGPSNVVTGDGRCSITFTDADGYLPGVLAITPTSTVVEDTLINGRWYRPGEIVDADLLFNSAQFAFSTPTHPGDAAAFDLRALAVHELGHFFGLSHTSLVSSTMFYVVPRDDSAASLEADDLALLRRAYGSPAAELSLEGRILRGDGITPVPGAGVYAIAASDGDTLQMTISGMDGTYQLFEVAEDFRVWVQPLDGTSAVNGLTPGRVNSILQGVAEVDFLPEYWDEAGENNADTGTGFVVTRPGAAVTGADVLINIDLQAPQVVGTSPVHGETSAPANAILSIRFSERIDRDHFYEQPDLALRDVVADTGVAGGAALILADSMIVYTPTAPLAFARDYRLTIGPDIRDFAGNPMAAAVTVDFRTEDQPPPALAGISPGEAPVGGALVLSGSGFSPDPAVNQIHFTGGGAVPSQTATLDRLVVTVPPNTVSGPVSVQVGLIMSGSQWLDVLPPKTPPSGNLVGEAPLGPGAARLAAKQDGAHAYVATSVGVTAVVTDPAEPDYLHVTEIPVAGGCTDVAVVPGDQLVVAVGPEQPRLRLVDANPASGSLHTVIAETALLDEPLGVVVLPGGEQAVIAFVDRAVLHDVRPGPTLGAATKEWTPPDCGFAGYLAVSSSAGEVYATTSDGRIAVLSLDPNESIAAVLSAGLLPRGVAGLLDGSGFLAVTGDGALRHYGVRGPLRDVVAGTGGFEGLAISPEGSFAYAANFIENRVDVIDLQGAAPRFACGLPTGANPVDVATGGGGRYLLVASGGRDVLEIYDTESGPVLSGLSPRSGAPGTLVTLFGSGFHPDPALNEVILGGASHVPERADAGGAAVVVRLAAGAGDGSASVLTGGQASNQVPFEVVERTDPGSFLPGPVLPLGSSPIVSVVESPTGALLVAVHQDGSVSALRADPSRSGFLQTSQNLTPGDMGSLPAASAALSADGKKLYVMEQFLGRIRVLLVDENVEQPLQPHAWVTDAGSPVALLAEDMVATPDGGRMLMVGPPGASLIEIDVASGEVLAITDQPGMSASCVAAHPLGTTAYLGGLVAGSPVVRPVDIDPASPGYRTAGPDVAMTAVAGPHALVASPDGTRLHALVTDSTSPTVDYGLEAVDTDAGSGLYHTVVGHAAVAQAQTPAVLANHSGSLLYVLDGNLGQVRALDAATLAVLPGAATSARLAGATSLAISRDDGRLYAAAGDDSVMVIDVTAAESFTLVSGFSQVGAQEEPLIAPYVVRLWAADPAQAQGGVVTFRATTQGNFGAGRRVWITAADETGLAKAWYTPGPDPGLDTVRVESALGNHVVSVTVLEDTTVTSPRVIDYAPESAALAPGVSTPVVVDFTKSVDPATVEDESFHVGLPGGGALPGRFSYADNQRRVVFQPDAALSASTVYEVVLTSELRDYSQNRLGNPLSFTFTTDAAEPLELHSITRRAGRIGHPVVLSGRGFSETPGENQILFEGVATLPEKANPAALTVTVPHGAATGYVRVVVGSDTSNARHFRVLPPKDNIVSTVSGVTNVPLSGQNIAIVPDGSRAYMSSPAANATLPLWLWTQTPGAPIPCGVYPFALGVSPTGDRLYVTNYFSHDISVISTNPEDPDFHKVVASIPVGLNPTGVAAHPDGHILYVVNHGDSTLTFVDTDSTSAASYSARATIPTGKTTQTVALTPDGGRIIVGISDGLLIIDADDTAARSTVPTGKTTQSIAVTPDGGLAVLLATDGTLMLIDVVPGSPTEGQARATVPTGKTSQSIAVSPDGGFVFVSTTDNYLLVYKIRRGRSYGGAADQSDDLVSIAAEDSVAVGEGSAGLAFDPSGSGLLVVVNAGDNTLSYIETDAEDSEAPAGLADLAASAWASGNASGADTTRIDITWTTPPEGDAAQVRLYRKGYGFYPEYDDSGGQPPSVPADPDAALAAGWTHVTDCAASTPFHTDGPETRDCWYYVAFVTDDASNVSAVSNLTGGTLNYHLGDVAPGGGDDLVTGLDISALGDAYGAEAGDGHYDPELDVGPTSDDGTLGRPLTDDQIQFEDMMIFAINYGMVSKPEAAGEEPNAIGLRVIRTAGAVVAAVDLWSNGSVQGLSVPLVWNPAAVEPTGFQDGAFLHEQTGTGRLFAPAPGAVDAVVFGSAFRGAGELARITFRVIGPGDPGIVLGEVLARDPRNRPLELAGVEQVYPLRLFQSRPNPFRGSTLIAFQTPVEGPAVLRVFNVAGRMVAVPFEQMVGPGRYEIEWDGRDAGGRRLAGGVYFYRLETPSGTRNRKMILLR